MLQMELKAYCVATGMPLSKLQPQFVHHTKYMHFVDTEKLEVEWRLIKSSKHLNILYTTSKGNQQK